jgi:hypothetical protein
MREHHQRLRWSSAGANVVKRTRTYHTALITDSAPNCLDLSNPFQWLERALAGLDGCEPHLHKALRVTDSGAAILECGLPVVASVLFSKEDSLPVEIRRFGRNGDLLTLSILKWTQTDGVWLPSVIDVSAWTKAGRLYSEDHISLASFTPRAIEESKLTLEFPEGTKVTNKTVSPPSIYTVNAPPAA